MYLKVYKEEDFIAGNFKTLYENEDRDASEAVCKIVCDGKNIKELSEKPGTLEPFATIRDIITEIAPNFASEKFGNIKESKSAKKFLNNFTSAYFPTVKEMTLLEKYEQWVAFVMQRFIFRKEIPFEMTPLSCEENGYIERLFVSDPTFPITVASVYGKAAACGYTNEVGISQLVNMVDECVGMYETDGYITYKTISDWAIAYFKSKKHGDCISGTVFDTLKIILTIDDEMNKRGKSLKYEELADLTSYVMQNSEKPLENYKEWIDLYEIVNSK